MTRFYVDGKWVELDELIEKAELVDTLEDEITRRQEDTGMLLAIKDMISTDLSNHDKLSAIEDILIGDDTKPLNSGEDI